MKTRNKTNSKMLICLALVLVLITGALGYLTKGFTDWNYNNWLKKPVVNVDESFNDLPMDGNGNIMGDGVHEMPQNLVFRSPSLASAQSDGVTLTATVKPTTATNKKVSWTVAFVNPGSAWATGKTVTNYVTVIPTEVGSPTATVRCVIGFSEKIKIVVSSVADSNMKAECVVNYANRLTSLNLMFKGSNSKGEAVNYTLVPEQSTALPVFTTTKFTADLSKNASTYVYGEGTLTPAELSAIPFALKSGKGTNQYSSSFEDFHVESSIVPNPNINIFPSPTFTEDGLHCAGSSGEGDYYTDEISNITNRIAQNSIGKPTQSLLKFEYTVSCSYYETTFVYYMNIGDNTYNFVTGVELGNGTIIF